MIYDFRIDILFLTPSSHNILLADSGNDPQKNSTLMKPSMLFKEVMLSGM
ncbi:MAG: hypothetical protein ABSB78_05495 [Bacteroidota bacterium]